MVRTPIVMLVVMLVVAVAILSIQLRQKLARGWRDRKWLVGQESPRW